MPIEARDASGNVESTHVEVVSATGMMMAAFFGVGVLAVGGTVLLVGVPGVFGVLGAILLGLLALLTVGSLGLSCWGRYVGMPWRFTA